MPFREPKIVSIEDLALRIYWKYRSHIIAQILLIKHVTE